MEVTPRVARKAERGEGITVTVATPFRGTVSSFTGSGEVYDVDLLLTNDLRCSCPRYEKTRTCVKHPVVFDAVAAGRRHIFFCAAKEERVIELCAAIFAPIRKGEHPADSYKFFLTVQSYPYSTKAMVEAARIRHEKVLLRHGVRRVA